MPPQAVQGVQVVYDVQAVLAGRQAVQAVQAVHDVHDVQAVLAGGQAGSAWTVNTALQLPGRQPLASSLFLYALPLLPLLHVLHVL